MTTFDLADPLSDDDRWWLMAPLNGASKKKLVHMLECMPDQGASCPGHGRQRTIAVIKAHINACRAEYWNAKRSPAPKPPSRKFDGVSASEANDWLRSLPRADEGTMRISAEQENAR